MKNDYESGISERLGAALRETHHRVEAAESSRISQAEMATRLRVSQRTYVDWLNGRGPSGARAVLDLLSMLDDREAVEILRRWREGNRSGKNNGGDSGVA
jgi:hypothetical protein